MKALNRIAKAVAVVIMLMTFSALAGECKEITSGLIVSQGLETEKNLICIVQDGREIGMLIYENDGGALVSKNSTLLEASDIADETVHLEPSSNGFKVYFEYSNNIYIVGFDVNAKNITESNVLMRLDAVEPNDAPQMINLVVVPEKLMALEFESLNKAQLFDSSFLSLGQPFSAKITTQKAQVSYVSDASGASESYIFHGERVKVVDLKNGWVKVEYEELGGDDASGWIRLANIL